MTATLDVTDLRKQFSIGRPAIDGVSFSVPAGEIVVLLGPSGCGKTTTLRCVAGDRKSHTSELQSRVDLVCRLLLEKKKKKKIKVKYRDHRKNETRFTLRI